MTGNMAHLWASVILAVSAVLAVTVVTITGADVTPVLTVIGTAIVPTTTILLTGRALASRVEGVQQDVNGRMREVVAKLPPAERDGG